MGIIIAIIIFSAIVLFHEFGHFLLAKKNGIVVTEFSLGMGPRILSTVKGETRYSWKLLPFGGSCAMLGEDGEDESEGTFNSKGVWARISVIAAGPIFNFILAFLVAIIVIGVVGYDKAEVIGLDEDSPAALAGLQEGDVITGFQGKNIDISRELTIITELDGLEPEETELTFERDGEEHTIDYMPNSEDRYMLGFGYSQGDSSVINSVSLGLPLDEAGVQAGDKVTAINGTAINSGDELAAYFEEHPMGEEIITFEYERNGKVKSVEVTPKMTTYTTLGFSYNSGRVKTSAIGTLKYSAIELKYWVKLVYKSLYMLVKGQFSVQDLSGPVGVVDVIDTTYNEARQDGVLMTWMNMLNLVILLSANLGVMNLLPLPALDGGRLVFLIIEAIRGKAVNREVEGMVHFAGLVLLMILMVVIMYNDIMRIF
ncbi:MAG: RIP metalloprotease RseP [Lachnospiraceae bacterium]|nr:RIP metalloprotease RseP [Lachnospiraceae bacterium]MDD3616414.1 RIP metalloprotease RseP [Lachnospiraceae bacterium]